VTVISDSELSLAHGVVRAAVRAGHDDVRLDPSFVAEVMRELRERRLRDEVKAGAVADVTAAMRLTMIIERI
jgi:hypothetical protein